jgi:hypothetical protein
MRCDECLVVIEEYLDGELEGNTNEQVSAHLSACVECAEAFDALLGEQELYANYQRDVEVTPALWQNVYARIEREKAAAPKPLPFSERFRAGVASLFVLPRFTPALAASLSLVAFCAVAASIWFARLPQQKTPTDIAQGGAERKENNSVSAVKQVTPQTDVSSKGSDTNETTVLSGKGDESVARNAEKIGRARLANASSSATVDERGNQPVIFNHDHAIPEDTLSSLTSAVAVVSNDTTQLPTAPADPEDAEVSSHIEKAQLLLTSFRNADDTESEAGGEIAYEKQRSKELLNENILLRRDAEAVGNLPARQLLSTLEPFLLDISNLNDQPSKEDVRSIKERMKKNEIIAALQVY